MNSKAERILNEIKTLDMENISELYEYLYRALNLRCAPELEVGMCAISFDDDVKYIYKERKYIREGDSMYYTLAFDVFVNSISNEELQLCLTPPPAVDLDTYIPYRHVFKSIYTDINCTNKVWPISEEDILQILKEN